MEQKPGTILDTVLMGQAFRLDSGLLTGSVVIDGEPMQALALDNGNDRLKGATLNARGKLVDLVVPTCYRVAETVRSGKKIVTYQVDDGVTFWTGEEALKQEGEALPIGSTDQRLRDPRQREFMFAQMVELLVKAGLRPGDYKIALGLAVPNDEMELDTRTDSMGVRKSTRDAIKAHLRGKTAVVVRTDERGTEGRWKLTVDQVMPQAQSVGTYYAAFLKPNGDPATDLESLSVIDIGGGDLQATQIDMEPYRMRSARLGDGAIALARALARRLADRTELNDAQALQALKTGKARIAGRSVDISDDIKAVVSAQGEGIVARVLPYFRQTDRFLVITAGGSILLREKLEETAKTTRKAEGEHYLIVDAKVAVTANVIGTLFGVFFAAAAE